MYGNALSSRNGMTTGEPYAPVRHSWAQVHERARRVAGGLAAAGVGHGDAVAVLAGAPVEIAPTAQGLWMRGASLTMLHQPTPRTDLRLWATETASVIGVIEARVVVISDPFMAAAPLLDELGLRVVTVEQLLAADPIDPVDTGEDDAALLQLTSGCTGSPKAVRITHRNVVSNAEAMFAYSLFAKRLRKQAKPGEFDLSSLRWALSGAEQVEPADVEDLCEAGASFGLRPEAIVPAYGMAATTVAVSFSECGSGLVVDEVDADLLAVLRHAVPARKGKTRRLACLGPALQGMEVRIVDEDANVLPSRCVGVIQVRGEPVTLGYATMG